MAAHFLFLAAASLFSAETQDVTPVTTPGNSQVGAEPKPPVSETSSWTIADRSDSSMIVADSMDDPAAKGQVVNPLPQGPSPSHRDNDESKHDPITDETPHVDMTPAPAHGAPRPSPPLPDLPGGKPILPKLLTSAQVEPRDSNSPGTAFYTPARSGEAVDRGPFDSAVNIRVQYSGSGSPSQAVTGPTRNVVDVSQPVGKWKTKYQFPTQALPSLRSNPETTEDGPRHELVMSLTRPLRAIRERRGDSTFSFSTSPFDEFERDGGPSRRVSEANTSTIPRRGSRSRPKSKLSVGDDGNGGQSNKETTFRRQKGKSVVPRWDGRSEGDHGERGKERDDFSYISTPTDYVSVSSDAREHSRDQTPTPVSPTQPGMRYTT